jgi:hypothetical protein
MACDNEVSISTSTNNLHSQVFIAAVAQMMVSWLSTLCGVISLFQLLGQVDEEHPPELNCYPDGQDGTSLQIIRTNVFHYMV